MFDQPFEKREKDRKSWKMKSFQIGLGFVAVFSVGFYFGLQQKSDVLNNSPQLSPNSETEIDLNVPVGPIPKNLPKETPEISPLPVSEAGSSYSSSSDEANSAHYADQEKSEIPPEPEVSETEALPVDQSIEPEVEQYDAEKEIKYRRDQWSKACTGRRSSIMSLSYRTNLVSRWGVSTGNVNFFTCFLPKAASSSMSAAMLLATGWIDKAKKNEITDQMWDNGRNKCPKSDRKCLKEFNQMPQRYRYMGANLPPDDGGFVSLIIAREPMDRLVSAWKDKIYRRTDRQFYYDRYTKSMLNLMGKRGCPSKQSDAWDQGCRVPFADFIRYVAAGNQAADEHWTPAVNLCVSCQANYTFVGHSEHFNEDIMVAAKMLKIDESVLPDSYKEVNLHAAAGNTDVSKASEKKTSEEMFADVPEATLRQIRNIYRADYETFGYEMPEWLKNA